MGEEGLGQKVIVEKRGWDSIEWVMIVDIVLISGWLKVWINRDRGYFCFRL